MMDLILRVAAEDPRIRLVTLEGSRANPNARRDAYQDFDITYHVTDLGSYLADPSWLDVFGPRLMMQEPEAMELFPAEWPGHSYLIFFADYHKLDLTLLPLDELEGYLRDDKMIRVLLDKDQRIPEPIIPSDAAFHVRKPSERSYTDACNEFWHVCTYVVKGLLRSEILFAIDHLTIMRQELLRMLAWRVGEETDYSLSVAYLPPELWARLLQTYRCDSYEACWTSLDTMLALFRELSRDLASRWHYRYPPYDAAISGYVEAVKHGWRPY